MSDGEQARDHLPPPSSTTEAQEILRRASGGRLLLRMLLGLVIIGAVGAGVYFGRRMLRVKQARETAMIALSGRSVRIGNNQRGNDEARGDAASERPAHDVEALAFRLDVNEVTVSAFRICVEDGGCKQPAATTGSHCNFGRVDREEHPMNCVAYDQAEAFCAWANKRLPTEVEWEYAAGGASPKRLFPWGDTLPVREDANVCGAECTAGARPTQDFTRGTICGKDGTCRPELVDFDDGFPETAPVGSFPQGKTPEGAFDLAGNVWEWTSSSPCVYPSHVCPDTGERILRGGGWTHRNLMSPEVTTRMKVAVGTINDGIGFRCAR